MESIKVLAIDGGGIGDIPAIILAELQKRLGKNLYEVFDLIAGDFHGRNHRAWNRHQEQRRSALYAGPTAGPLRAKRARNLQKEPADFAERNHFPKYSPGALEGVLAQFFQATEFKTALTPLLISSYDLHKQRPFIFKSHYIAAHPNYNWEVKSIARATSAAPTFFPPLHLTKGAEDYALVDGGVFVNNPAMAAYAEARSLYSPNSTSLSSFPWAPATGRITSNTAKPGNGDCWAGLLRSCRFLWTASPRLSIINLPSCRDASTTAFRLPICKRQKLRWMM